MRRLPIILCLLSGACWLGEPPTLCAAQPDVEEELPAPDDPVADSPSREQSTPPPDPVPPEQPSGVELGEEEVPHGRVKVPPFPQVHSSPEGVEHMLDIDPSAMFTRRRYGGLVVDPSAPYANDGTWARSHATPRNPRHYVDFAEYYGGQGVPWYYPYVGYYYAPGGIPWYRPFYYPYPPYPRGYYARPWYAGPLSYYYGPRFVPGYGGSYYW